MVTVSNFKRLHWLRGEEGLVWLLRLAPIVGEGGQITCAQSPGPHKEGGHDLTLLRTTRRPS